MGFFFSILRVNVGVVICGNRFFVVGGFSGKKFLDSMEFFFDIYGEWCCYFLVENLVIVEKMVKRNLGISL